MTNSIVTLSFEEKWEKIILCDRKYDGLFYTAVKTTKIYCRPSCRSRKPKKVNVLFYDEISEVEQAGYRACKRCQPRASQSPQTELIQKIIAYLVNHSKQSIRLGDVANHVGVSPYYLERLFQKETNETPRSYLEKIRIDRAAHLLKTTALKNSDICYESGFQSLSNFYKAFRKVKGHSPNEFRKEQSDELERL